MRGTRGPLGISANGRYFIDSDGSPFFWLGDTAWPLFTRYPRSVVTDYFRTRAAQGYTVIQGVLAWGKPEIRPGGALAGANLDGERPWRATPSEPNPAFFQTVDGILQEAERSGLHVAVFPAWANNVRQAKAFTPESAFAYGRWIGERYREQPNIVWACGGDQEPLGFEDTWRAMARGLREGDGGAHLITYHPCGWRSSSYYFHSEDWLDFNMIETWSSWDMVYPAISADYAMTPIKPVVLGEPAYENGPEYPDGPITPLIVRRQAWWSFMAGGFFTYGQDQMWRLDAGWEGTFDTPGARQMGLFRQIAQRVEWWRMIPDAGLFGSGSGDEQTRNVALRSTDRTTALLYLSHRCRFLLNLDRIATAAVRATWINPATGEEQEGGTYETGNLPGDTGVPRWNVTQWFHVPPRWEDAVLLLAGMER